MEPDLGDDPIAAPFWAAAAEHRLLLQRCRRCSGHQFYPRPFCLACESAELEWTEASGGGTIYSTTTVRVQVRPELEPPYDVALVQLDEGPRFLSVLPPGAARIGDRVVLAWREREGLPPLPEFTPAVEV